MERRELSAADIYCKFAAQLDEDGFRLYHAAQQITGFQPYNAFPYPLMGGDAAGLPFYLGSVPRDDPDGV